MDNAILLSLPQDILVLIFKKQSTIADVFNLSQTCRGLQHTYKSEERAIAHAVVPREIDGYDEALKLATAEELDKPIAPGTANSLLRRLFANARRVALLSENARNHFSIDGANHRRHCIEAQHRDWCCDIYNPQKSPSIPIPALLPHERARIITSWYFLEHAIYSCSREADCKAKPEQSPALRTFKEQLTHMNRLRFFIIERLCCFFAPVTFYYYMDPPEVLKNFPKTLPPWAWYLVRDAIIEISWKRNFNNHDPRFGYDVSQSCDTCWESKDDEDRPPAED